MVIDLTTSFKCKTFNIGVNGSVKFVECEIFTNVNHFRDIYKEYKLKHRYHLKRYINKKEKVEVTCMGDGYVWRIYVSLVFKIVKLSWLCLCETNIVVVGMKT